mmetsp:Transcript_10102/g.27495  ORF Transcript_10102/g.27495 Transcript_10102/m.27495 type:complete len:270 (+) Transcript_10102:2499-3308(+)
MAYLFSWTAYPSPAWRTFRNSPASTSRTHPSSMLSETRSRPWSLQWTARPSASRSASGLSYSVKLTMPRQIREGPSGIAQTKSLTRRTRAVGRRWMRMELTVTRKTTRASQSALHVLGARWMHKMPELRVTTRTRTRTRTMRLGLKSRPMMTTADQIPVTRRTRRSLVSLQKKRRTRRRSSQCNLGVPRRHSLRASSGMTLLRPTQKHGLRKMTRWKDWTHVHPTRSAARAAMLASRAKRRARQSSWRENVPWQTETLPLSLWRTLSAF